ncbi:Alpha/Beta hydrolase protein [Peziza echinospora]|nr:Alpha/Beta hydrolase protein [Peziza echinospora]
MAIPMLRALLPKVPYLLTSSANHFLSLNPHSKDWDFRTFITVTLLKSFMSGEDTKDANGNPISIEKIQRLANSEQTLEDDCWVVEASVPLPELEEEVKLVEELMDRAIRELARNGDAVVDAAKVSQGVLTGEFVGWRNVPKRGAYKGANNPHKKWKAERKFEALREDVAQFKIKDTKEGVVLWLHGGAYIMCDPCTHRPIGKHLSKEFGGLVFLPRYRLAPQNPFPSALLDSFISYLSLLYPQPGALNSPYPADQIFLAGDSAGGGLALSLIQLLLWFQTPNEDGSAKKIKWGGILRDVPLPKGVQILSGWVDLSRCFVGIDEMGKGGASETSCADGDYLPGPTLAMHTLFGPSAAWPANPPRTHFYANDSAITHPLVSPLAAKSWAGCPPVWACVGDECLRDSNYYWAHRLVESSVPLHMEKYTSLPHVFPLILQHHPCAPRAFSSMGKFLAHHLSTQSSTEFEYRRIRIHPKTLAETPLEDSVLSMGGLTMDELLEKMDKEVTKWASTASGGELTETGSTGLSSTVKNNVEAVERTASSGRGHLNDSDTVVLNS